MLSDAQGDHFFMLSGTCIDLPVSARSCDFDQPSKHMHLNPGGSWKLPAVLTVLKKKSKNPLILVATDSLCLKTKCNWLLLEQK